MKRRIRDAGDVGLAALAGAALTALVLSDRVVSQVDPAKFAIVGVGALIVLGGACIWRFGILTRRRSALNAFLTGLSGIIGVMLISDSTWAIGCLHSGPTLCPTALHPGTLRVDEVEFAIGVVAEVLAGLMLMMTIIGALRRPSGRTITVLDRALMASFGALVGAQTADPVASNLQLPPWSNHQELLAPVTLVVVLIAVVDVLSRFALWDFDFVREADVASSASGHSA